MSEKYERMTEQEYMKEVRDLDKLLHDFCEGSDLYSYESVKININTLKDIIVRVHKRKHYFKVFHNAMITSEYKETALYCYWFLKLRPLWIDPDNASLERINEKFALHLYISLLKKYNEDFSEEDGINKLHIRELLYSFRFRDITKESMILMLEPYYYEHLKKADAEF
ncbi:MAG: hypothetical protein HFH41_07800 [Lachnospiraceae bacterium]|nr:hypothetical protein [Lachnospiraceae bacterium]